jgi:hypothetical protein
MREYLIFKCEVLGEVYVDAYRIDDKPTWFIDRYVDFDNIAYVSSPSRTEAKRCAWKNWINKDLIGFKEWHQRIMDKFELNKV